MLFSQWITLTEDSPKAPVGGIRLEDVGLCGVSDLQDWCAREVTLKSLESSFLVVTPVHLVGLTLSGEVSQGCCNCRKTRNESVVVANKTQEGPDVGLRYRSGELSNSLHFARIWLDDPPTDDVSEIGNLDSPKAALTELQSQPSDVKTTEHLPEVSTVFFPVLTEYRDIQVRTEKLLAVSDYTSDHSLECCQSTVKTKGHDFKFEQAKWCGEGGLITGLGIHRDLPVATGWIKCGHHHRGTNALEHFLNEWHGICIKSRYLVEFAKVHAEPYSPILLLNQYYGRSPRTRGWSDHP